MTAFSYERGNSVLNEDSTKKKSEKKKDKKKKKDKALQGLTPTIIDKYNGMEAKSNVNNSLIKSLVDVVAAGLVGPALSASIGKYSPLAGIALSFGGHYTGDESGILRGIGMSTIAHAVAKSNEYRDPNSTLQTRLSELKDDWLRMVLFGGSEQKQISIDGIEKSTVEIEPLEELPTPIEEPENETSIEDDLTNFELNHLSMLEEQAMDFEHEKNMEQQFEHDESQQHDSNPLDWMMDNWEQSSPHNQYDEPSQEVDLPDDFDFSDF